MSLLTEVLYKDIDLQTIQYENPIQINNKKKYLAKCTLSKDDKLIESIKIPNLILYSNGIYDKNKLDLCISSKERKLFNFLEKFDEKNIECLQNNCQDWFKKELPFQILQDFYITTVENKNNYPIIVIKIRQKNIKEYVKNLKKGDVVDIVMKIKGISILKSNFLLDWCIESLTLSEKNKLIKENEIASENSEIIDNTEINETIQENLEIDENIQENNLENNSEIKNEKENSDVNEEINEETGKNIDETDKMSIIDLKIKEIKEIQKNLIIEEDKVINLKKVLSEKMRELTESQLDIYSSTH